MDIEPSVGNPCPQHISHSPLSHGGHIGYDVCILGIKSRRCVFNFSGLQLVMLNKIIHASGVLDFLLDRTALWVGGLRKVGIELELRHIGLHRVAGLQV